MSFTGTLCSTVGGKVSVDSVVANVIIGDIMLSSFANLDPSCVFESTGLSAVRM